MKVIVSEFSHAPVSLPAQWHALAIVSIELALAHTAKQRYPCYVAG